MNTTLAVVVSAIVILITALVVITIFSGGVGQIGSITNAQSICQTQAYSSCKSTNNMPLTWSIPSVSIPATTGTGNQLVACKDLPSMGSDCSAFGGTATSGGTQTQGCCIKAAVAQTSGSCRISSSSTDCTIGESFSAGTKCVPSTTNGITSYTCGP